MNEPQNPRPAAASDEENAERHLLTFERLLKAHEAMTEAEKAELHAWETQYVTGDGEFARTDWPGWPAVIARISN